MNFKCLVRYRLSNSAWRRPPPSIRAVIVAALLTVGQSQAPARSAAQPARVVSINLCTDQLLLALAAPGQIAGLSRFSRHAETSYLAVQAGAYPSLRGSAEEVLQLKPDLVLAGVFSGGATRAILNAHAVRVETFAPPRSIQEAKAEIDRMAQLLGQPARGAALAAEIDAAAMAASAAAAGRPAISALPIERRGFASGSETLLSSAIEAAGFSNAASALGISSIGRVPIEAMLKLAPDILMVEGLTIARDQSTAFLHHPALARAFPPSRVMALPASEVTCGGPSLAPLIRRLAGYRTAVR